MTRKEAINQLQDAKDGYEEYLSDEAIDMAIEALENQKIGHWKIWAETINCFNFTLGDFTETEYHCKCSECGTEIIPEESMHFQFCPICGTKMEGDRRMTEIERMQAFSYLDGAADGLNEARNDVIKELEKIKDSLEVAMWYNRRDKEYCLELIGKRISELKGENKLTCDRNICLKNEYSNIGCEDCVVTKGENK